MKSPLGDFLRFRKNDHLLLTLLILGALTVASVPLVFSKLSVQVTDVLDATFALVAAAAALYTSASAQGRTRRGWLYIGAGTLAWAVGEILWAYYEVVLGDDAPFPSVADVSYLIAYPMVLAGILQLAIPRRPAAIVRTLLDAAVLMFLAAAPVWFYVLEPIASTTDASTLEVVLGLSYPCGDLLLVFGLAVAALRRPREESGAILGTLGLGLSLFMAADFAFAILSQSDEFASGSLLDAAWLAGYALIAVAAIWQHRWQTDHAVEDEARSAAAWRQAIPLTLLLPAFAWDLFAAGSGAGGRVVAVLLILALVAVVARSVLGLADVLLLNKELDESAGRLEAANTELSSKSKLLNKLLVEAVALSRRDSLTALLNHGAVIDELSITLADNPDGVYVAMLDVDNMKRLNDEGGHQAGDEALRTIARTLKAHPQLTAGRYGGDEFLVFATSDDFEAIMAEVVGTLKRGAIGVSWGGATYPDDSQDIMALIQKADQRLYRAKRARRQARRSGEIAA